MKAILFVHLFLIIFGISNLDALEKTNIYFDSGSFKLKADEDQKLTNLRLGNLFLLKGHTDVDGDHDYNLNLSKQRVEQVKKELVRLGVDPSKIETSYFGEERPVNDNLDDTEKSLNRRVEVIHIEDVLMKHEVVQQQFSVKYNTSTTITTSNNIKFSFNAHTFSEDVTINIREYTTKEEIISANLSTQTEKGEDLESGGMFYIEAIDKNGLSVQPSKPYEIDYGVLGLVEGFRLFEGKRDQQFNVNWTAADQSNQEKRLEQNVEFTNNTLAGQFAYGIEDFSWSNFRCIAKIDLFDSPDSYSTGWANFMTKTVNRLRTDEAFTPCLMDSFQLVIENKNGAISSRYVYTSELDCDKFKKDFLHEVRSYYRSRNSYKLKPKESILLSYNGYYLDQEDLDDLDTSPLASMQETVNSINNTATFSLLTNGVLLSDSTIQASETLNEINNEIAQKAMGTNNEGELQKFGWINIDRFLKSGPRATLKVIADNKTNIRVLLKDFNAYYNGVPTKNGQQFTLPWDEPILLIATKKVNGVWLMDSKKIIARNRTIDKFDFQPYTENAKSESLQLVDNTSMNLE